VTYLLDQQKRHTRHHSFGGFAVVCDGMMLALGQPALCAARATGERISLE